MIGLDFLKLGQKVELMGVMGCISIYEYFFKLFIFIHFKSKEALVDRIEAQQYKS